MGQLKILFSGPVCSGKSTAIAAISDIPPVATEKRASGDAKALKDRTTVAMDYGLMKLGNGQTVHLYGTPGQQRFDFMWEILSKGVIGTVILVNNAGPAPLDELVYYLDALGSLTESSALAVGVTRTDLKQSPTIADYHRVLKEKELNIPLFEVDARKAEEVITLLQAMLYSLDPGVQIPGASPRSPVAKRKSSPGSGLRR